MAKKHPLKMTFDEFLSRMNDEQLRERLGIERTDAYKNGEMPKDEYCPPLSGQKYTVEDLKRDDIASFKEN